jgi:phage terminase large subunit
LPTIRLPNKWTPRPYQLNAWRAWESGIKRCLLVWHRRAGKDEVALHKTAVAAHQRVANYWHCLPMYEQARKAIWEAINPHTGRRRIDEAFPQELRARTDNSSMTIEFKIGSIWKVVGSDNPDSLVGAPPAGLVFSEWALANPSAWGYLAPILIENNGWADFITTPRGRNHVKTMYDMAKGNPQWFAEILTPNETGFPVDRVEEQRKEYHSIFGIDEGDALIDQEYWCSFEAAILGAYWGKEMVLAEHEKRITQIDPDPEQPVHCAWDLGVGDSTAIWFFQMAGPQIHVIDYYEASGYAIEHYAQVKKDKGYRYGVDYVPQDAKVREFSRSTGAEDGHKARQRVEVMIELGLVPEVVTSHRTEDGINAARRTLGRCWFDAKRCERGLEMLRQYRKEWDDDRKVYKNTPLHDWTSHGADAFRYLAMAWEEVAKPVQKRDVLAELLKPKTLNDMLREHELQQED